MTILIGTGIVVGLIMLLYFLKSKKPLRTAFKSMFSGGVSLVLASYFGYLINIKLTLSFFTTIIALVLGAPGVIIMIIGKLILV